MRWLVLVRPGDWLSILLGFAVCAAAFPLAWQSGAADKAIVMKNGQLVAELDLRRNRQITVEGPLGTTTIVVRDRRVRVASDPGLHQYCVRQGWLQRAGEIAICAPNQVSVQVVGHGTVYDSLSY